MKQTKWVVCSVLTFSILAAAGSLLAEETEAKSPEVTPEAKMEKQKKPGLNIWGKKMVEVCKLNDEQAKKLAEAFEVNKQNTKAFKNAKANGSDKTNAQLMKELREKKKEARKTKDKQTYKALNDQLQPLNKEMGRIKKENKERIQSVLTEQQKYDWAGYMGGITSCRQLKKMGIKLTPEQKDKVITLCQGSGKDFYEAKDYKAKRPLYEKMHSQIDATILTPEQREIISKKAADKPSKTKAKKKSAEPCEGMFL